MNKLSTTDTLDLLQSYINALTNLMSMEKAKYAAEVSEQSVIRELSNLDKRNGLYLTPEDISPAVGEQVVKDSINAHLTKVQSEQIFQVAHDEISRLEIEVNKKYIGERVVISVLDPKSDVVDAVMIDKRTNQYRVSKYTAKKIKGTVEKISFLDNLLVIKPTIAARFIVPNRLQVHIYVINLQTMTPNITIQ